MAGHTILVADSSEVFLRSAAEVLREEYYVRCCHTGQAVLTCLQQAPPDILVLDLTLPELDFPALIDVLSYTRLVLLTGGGKCSKMIKHFLILRDDCHILERPCDLYALVKTIHAMEAELPVLRRNPRKMIIELMEFMTMRTSIHSYGYLLAAIEILFQNPRQAITKELYPAVAKACGGTTESVERAIRTAIENSWAQRDPTIWGPMFPTHIDRPSNSVFLHRMVRALRERME